MRSNRIGAISCLAFIVLVVSALCAAAESASLTIWEMPYERAFPAGFALDSEGRVYAAMSGGIEVYRLNPATEMFRSWGVGDRPASVSIVDDVVFCSVEGGNKLVYFDPESQGVSTSVLPFPDVSPRELIRGRTTDTGNILFWMNNWAQLSLLRFEYNPTTRAPGIYGTPSDLEAVPVALTATAKTFRVSYEQFSYDVSVVPDPYPLSPPQTSPPYQEWTFSLGDYAIYDLAPAEDGTVWISFGSPFLLRLDPGANTLQELETIPNAAIFNGLVASPDGSVWFINELEGAVGHLDLSLGFSETWRIPETEEIYDLAFADDHVLWFTDRLANRIGRLDLMKEEATVYQLPVDSEPLYLAIDGDGNIWFTAGLGNYIGRLAIGE